MKQKSYVFQLHVDIREIFGLVRRLIPKISPYVMAAAVSYKIS